MREELGQVHVLETTPHPQRSQEPSLCHVGTWFPQNPWRREHCSALGTWGVHPLFLWLSLLHGHIHHYSHATFINLLIDLSPSSLQSHHSLSNVHPNLKLSLLSLLWVIPLLGPSLFPQPLNLFHISLLIPLSILLAPLVISSFPIALPCFLHLSTS
ncbi:unnamed protein product [Microthlaspi erraticum]|uniref:Uncharacterized protein n=1 Tax=Microthlaspi erraticum TaxID=1685480 RepID=A0A6D2HY40_9BRAS|nr:unnamed protein product [Microthlaspi erraticum]